MPRTRTSHLTKFDNPTASFHFSEQMGKHVTTIIVPGNSNWDSGVHWHETHTEYLQVRKGTALVELNGEQFSVTAEYGPVTVPRGALHKWGRHASDDQELEVLEWTDPSDGEKELFFRSLFSFIQDMEREPASAHSSALAASTMSKGMTFTLQLMVVFTTFDNYPLIVPGAAGKPISRLLVVLASAIGRLVGLRPSHPEYTP